MSPFSSEPLNIDSLKFNRFTSNRFTSLHFRISLSFLFSSLVFVCFVQMTSFFIHFGSKLFESKILVLAKRVFVKSKYVLSTYRSMSKININYFITCASKTAHYEECLSSCHSNLEKKATCIMSKNIQQLRRKPLSKAESYSVTEKYF